MMLLKCLRRSDENYGSMPKINKGTGGLFLP